MAHVVDQNGAAGLDSHQADVEKGVKEATRAYIEQAVRKAVDAEKLGADIDIAVREVVDAEKLGSDIDKAVRKATEAQIEQAVVAADRRESGGSEIVFPYTEIKNILALENDPLYKVALKEWDRKEAYLGNRVDRREKASADLVNQLFNIVGFFSVFQGVVLTAVSQLKSDTFATCGIVWFPVILSSVAGVASIGGLWVKFRNLKELEDSIRTEKAAQKVAAKWATSLRGDGKEFFRFYEKTKEHKSESPRSFHCRDWTLYAAVILFTALFILSYFAILCGTLALPHHWYKRLEPGQ